MALLGSKNPQLTAMMHGGIKSLVKQAKDQIIRTFEYFDGDVKASATKLAISRATLNRWIKENPDLRAALDRIRTRAAARAAR
jgi:ApbE superfamily uncharacterized protein (UPF0280 family)